MSDIIGDTILEQFEKHGKSASFHYADDTCKEWGLAASEEKKAMDLFNAHPDLQHQMQDIARHFLWTVRSD